MILQLILNHVLSSAQQIHRQVIVSKHKEAVIWLQEQLKELEDWRAEVSQNADQEAHVRIEQINNHVKWLHSEIARLEMAPSS